MHIFSNAITNDTTRKPFVIKGIYIPGKGANYGGVYYDSLRDEYSDSYITLVFPALLHINLKAEQLIECSAYLTKKVQPAGARIELQVNVTELHSHVDSRLTEEQVKSFELQQKKRLHSYAVPNACLKFVASCYI